MNHAAPKITIVMPTYNQARFLSEALDGIFRQTLADFELIVVNDGSTDATPQILAEYQQRYCFTVIHQENRKLPGALNAGFSQARGQYLTWTSSDNIMLPEMLHVLAMTLDQNPDVGMVYADWECISDNGAPLGIVRTLDYDAHLLMRINYINACFLYRRECQDQLGLYDPAFIYAEDWEYWYRISKHFKVMRVPQCLYQYRLHDGSLTEVEVKKREQGRSVGYNKLAERFRSRPLAWYLSKIKWEWLRWKMQQDPQRCPILLAPCSRDGDRDCECRRQKTAIRFGATK